MNHLEYRNLPFAIYLFAFFFVVSAFGQRQGNCPNSDFSLGDFSNWEGYYGDFPNPALFKGFVKTRHTIIHDPQNRDPNTCGDGLEMVPPGEKYAVRLGNDFALQAEQLRYPVNVTEETNLFIYKYAVVMTDLPHDPANQPGFIIDVADSSGKVIDPDCGSYFVSAHHGIPTWHSCGEVSWKDWTTVGIDLRHYIGQTVSIIFTTRDCRLGGGHFGYAYLSAYCSKVELIFSFCPGDPIATVTAPPGFSYLWANSETTQSITIFNPVIGMVDSCVLTSVNGCKVTVMDTLKPAVVNANFGCPPQNCLGAEIQFHDSSTINPSATTNWIWYFGDGSPAVTNSQNPRYVYDSLGKFNVTLIVCCDGGCPDTITKPIEIGPMPEIHFVINSPCDEKGWYDTLYFNEQVQLNVGQGYDHYVWNTGDSTYSILVTDEGWYRVTIGKAGICFATDSIMMLQCNIPLRMPNAFSPNYDGKNDLFRPVVQPEGITAFHMLIFDQWGGTIFETQDIRQGWNGTIDEGPAPSGVFVYTITYTNPFGKKKKLTGTVTLVR